MAGCWEWLDRMGMNSFEELVLMVMVVVVLLLAPRVDVGHCSRKRACCLRACCLRACCLRACCPRGSGVGGKSLRLAGYVGVH